jgi:hypothetical protein
MSTHGFFVGAETEAWLSVLGRAMVARAVLQSEQRARAIARCCISGVTSGPRRHMPRRAAAPAAVVAVLAQLVLLSTTSAAVVTFTGVSSVDFASVTHQTVDDTTGDVTAPAGVRSGWDIGRAFLVYDAATDTLYVGVSAASGAIVGDADGDGDPGTCSRRRRMIARSRRRRAARHTASLPLSPLQAPRALQASTTAPTCPPTSPPS